MVLYGTVKQNIANKNNNNNYQTAGLHLATSTMSEQKIYFDNIGATR